jgi:hypothetical protein
MTTTNNRRKSLFVIGVVVVLLLNAYSFWVAYPETYTLTPGISADGDLLAKDFSAYYMGAWRLWNNPAHVYTFGAVGGGEPEILPHPEAYKYMPSFLVIISPLLKLDYQSALLAFNIFQFALLPFMAYLLYSLLNKKGLAITFIVIVVALLMPSPTPQWGPSVAYYWQWGEGQAKVLETFLLLLGLYLGQRGKPYLSGVALAFGFFDPRFGLLALPVFAYYNWGSLKNAFGSLAVMLGVSNLVLLYPGLGLGFLKMVVTSGLTTPVYYYSFIPLLTMLCLILVNGKDLSEKIKAAQNIKST